MTIDPSKIPGLNIDVESIRTNASDLSTKAGDMRTSGSTIKTTWAGMSSYYSALLRAGAGDPLLGDEPRGDRL